MLKETIVYNKLKKHIKVVNKLYGKMFLLIFQMKI